MSFTLLENWNTVTAPAIPAGWNVDTPFVTSTTYYFSSPNSLKLGTVTSSTRYYATSTADDTGGGSLVNMTGLVYFESAVSSGDAAAGGPMFRCSASTMDNSSTSCYWAYVAVNTSGTGYYLYFSKIVNGTVTILASVRNADGGLANGQWYAINVVSSSPSVFNVNLSRMSDGWTMNSSGFFVSSSTSAISGFSNTDIASGDFYGYAGSSSTISGSANDKVYFDDLQVNALPFSMSVRPRDPIIVRVPFQYYITD